MAHRVSLSEHCDRGKSLEAPLLIIPTRIRELNNKKLDLISEIEYKVSDFILEVQ